MVDLNYNIKISDEPEEPQSKQQLNFNNNVRTLGLFDNKFEFGMRWIDYDRKY